MPRILIQAGHVAPREPGKEGQTGTGGEIEFAAAMQAEVARLFRADKRFDVTLCPGDIPDGWTGDIFLSLHADGSTNPASKGYSFGWPANGRDPGKGPVLATRIARQFALLGHPGGHHADNYTDGMRGYYGWGRVNAPAKVLIEHGFLTNPGERAWMLAHEPEMARAIYEGTLDFLGLAVTPVAQAVAEPSPPWGAYVGTRKIGSGRFWPPTIPFIRAISRELRAGREVTIKAE